jgi:hypothetical protein
MIDKCRAFLSDALGEYIYPCPLDRHLLDFAGLTPDQFLAAVETRTDKDLLSWFNANTTPHTSQQIEDWNHMMLNRSPDSEEKWVYFRQIRDRLDPTRNDITTWSDLLDLEEERPVLNRT